MQEIIKKQIGEDGRHLPTSRREKTNVNGLFNK